MSILIDYALEHVKKKIWIVTDTYGNLEDGAMEDFKNICEYLGILKVLDENKTKHVFTFPNGTRFFFRALTEMKGRGPRRDVLFVNEANRITWEQFSQLEIRTNEKIYLDFNPSNEFWAHTELVNNKARDDVDFIKLNYLGNEALSENIIRALEMRKGDGTSNWWRVYGEGEIGSLEGNVYQGWLPRPEEEIRKGKLIRYGLDFGFSNDETALVAIYQQEDGSLGLVEEIYQKGILASKYPEILKSQKIDPTVLIVADGARPEIIADIQDKGFCCISALKDAGSVLRGIGYVQDSKIVYAGKNLEREYLTYAWRIQKSTGKALDQPQDGNDHLMDAIRYAIDDLHRPRFDF
nr:large terminase protein [Caudoviricetes sp.]